MDKDTEAGDDLDHTSAAEEVKDELVELLEEIDEVLARSDDG